MTRRASCCSWPVSHVILGSRKGAKVSVAIRPAMQANATAVLSMEKRYPFAPLRLCVRSVRGVRDRSAFSTRERLLVARQLRERWFTQRRKGAKVSLVARIAISSMGKMYHFATLRLCVRSLRSATDRSALEASRAIRFSVVSLREMSDSTSEMLLVARQSRDFWLTQRRKGAKVLRVSMPISRGSRRLDV
jgi:hypothetical protein